MGGLWGAMGADGDSSALEMGYNKFSPLPILIVIGDSSALEMVYNNFPPLPILIVIGDSSALEIVYIK